MYRVTWMPDAGSQIITRWFLSEETALAYARLRSKGKSIAVMYSVRGWPCDEAGTEYTSLAAFLAAVGPERASMWRPHQLSAHDELIAP